MAFEVIYEKGAAIAVLPETMRISDAASALDAALSARYETGADRLLVDKKLVCDEFFIFSTGLLGEMLQKFVNYRIKAAFYGDYARYTKGPLRDFIREFNKGDSFFFDATREEAIDKLAGA